MAQAPPAEKVEPPTGEPPSEEPKQPIDTVVFGIAAALSLLVLAFGWFATESFSAATAAALAWVTGNFNWMFVLASGGFVIVSIDPETGHHFDDTKRYIDALPIPEADKRKVRREGRRVGDGAHVRVVGVAGDQRVDLRRDVLRDVHDGAGDAVAGDEVRIVQIEGPIAYVSHL